MSLFRPFTLDDPFFHPYLTLASGLPAHPPRQTTSGGGNREITTTSDGQDVGKAKSKEHREARDEMMDYLVDMLERQGLLASKQALSSPAAHAGPTGLVGTPAGSSLTSWLNYFSPRLDLHEEADRYKLSVELAGVPRENVKLDVDEKIRRLTISGSVRSEYDSTKGHTADDPAESQNQGGHHDNGEAAKKVSSISSANGKDGRPIISERTYGSFSRSLILPETVDLASVKASFKDGVLSVDVPKKKGEEARVRRVTVEDGE